MATGEVYVIQNLCDGGLYIGCTWSTRRRWANHRSDLRRGSHHSVTLQAAWRRFGEEAFAFTVLHTVRLDDLLLAERFWIDALSPEYNSGSVRVHSAATRARIAETLRSVPKSAEFMAQRFAAGRVPTDADRARASEAHRGKPKSAEHRAKIAAALRLHKRTPEHSAAISSALKGRRLA